MSDLVVEALGKLVPGGVKRAEIARGDRRLRWVEAGAGSPTVVLDAAAGEPGSLAWAAVLPVVGARTRVVAYDRAGLGASDPAWPLDVGTQVDDLTAVIRATGNGPSVVAGHSWGGLLAQLAALQYPDVVAGLMLADPADEEFLSSPRQGFQHGLALGQAVLDQYARGELAQTVLDTFRPFAEQLTDDRQLRALILEAYISCYAEQSQARMVLGEHRLLGESLERIRQARAERAFPAVPVVVLSATTGTPRDEREQWTRFHAALAASIPDAEHVILADTSHAMNQERPAELASAINRVLDQILSQERDEPRTDEPAGNQPGSRL